MYNLINIILCNLSHSIVPKYCYIGPSLAANVSIIIGYLRKKNWGGGSVFSEICEIFNESAKNQNPHMTITLLLVHIVCMHILGHLEEHGIMTDLHKGVFKGGVQGVQTPPPKFSDFFLKSEGKEVERKREKNEKRWGDGVN